MELTKRQQDIVNATLEVISRYGITALTVKNIADELHITDAALYKHFRSKNEILESVADIFRQATLGILADISKDSGLTPSEKIRKFYIGRLEQFSANKPLTMVLFSDDIFRGENELMKKVNQTIESHKELLLGIIKEGQAIGELRGDVPPEHIFLTIMGPMRMMVMQWRASGFTFDLVEKGGKLLESAEKMLRKQSYPQ